MAEVILPPEETEPELPEEQLPEVEKPTEKSKVISVNFDPLNTKQTASLDTRESFYTTDTDAWVVLNVGDVNEPTGQYSLALINKEDGSIFQRVGDIVQGVAYYKLLPNEIKHAGRWVGQAVITLANGQTTASRFSFNVSGHILDGKDVREIVIQDFQTLMAQLNDLKDNSTNEFGLLKNEIEAFQIIVQENEDERQATESERVAAEIIREENYESKVTAAIVEADVVEKVDNKVAELAPTIQQVTAQLAQKKMLMPRDFLKKVKTKITPPLDFFWKEYPFGIYQTGDGYFVTDLEASDFQPTVNGKIYYVDGTNGSNTNDGLTLLTPLQSIEVARAKIDVSIIEIAEGFYQDDLAFNNNSLGDSGYKNLIIRAKEASNVIISTARLLNWVKDGDWQNVYRQRRTQIASIYDSSNLDGEGDYTPLKKVDTASEVNSEPNTYYYDGDLILIHTFDSRPADNLIIPFLNLKNLHNVGDYTIYAENIKFYGGNEGTVNMMTLSETGKPLFIAKNCEFKYASGGNGGLTSLGYDTILQNCVASNNYKDGFNYHIRSNRLPNAIEVDCVGRKNGLDETSYQDNGSTMHDGGKIIRVNGDYHHNRGPNCHDVTSGTESWNLGCQAHESVASVNTRVAGFQIENGKMWLDSCIAYDSPMAFRVPNGILNLRNSLFEGEKSVINTGIVSEY